MADQKITALTEDTSPTTDDLITTIDDVAGTPTNKKVTIANLDTLLSATTKTLTNKTLTSPKFVDSDFLADPNGNEILALGGGGVSSVNYTQIDASISGQPVYFNAYGDDTNVGILISGQGNGKLTLNSGTDLDVAANFIHFADAKGIKDANENESLVFQTTASAVNEFEMTNAATGNAPQLAVTGGDSNIDFKLASKGTGVVKGHLQTFQVQLLAEDTDQATATTIGGDYRISTRAITIVSVSTYCDTAGTTGTYTVDINEAGTTILSTKLTVDSTEKTSETAATPAVISDSSIAANAIVTFDLDAVQTTAAKGLKILIEYYYT